MFQKISIKRVVLFVLLICNIVVLSQFLTSFSFADERNNNYTLNTNSKVSDTFLNNNLLANEVYNTALFEYYHSSDNYYLSEYGSYTVNGIYANGFPEYYCGAYTNTDGNLVVLLNANMPPDQIRSALSDVYSYSENDNIVIGYADHNMRELVSTMSLIADSIDIMRNNNELFITSCGINEYNNCIDVFLFPYSNETIETVLKYIPYSEVLSFYESEGDDELLSSPAYCGEGISYLWSSPFESHFSIGFRARRSLSTGGYVNGFVTCGHAFSDYPSSSCPVYYSDWWLGEYYPTDLLYTNGGTADAAFITSVSDVLMNVVSTHYSGLFVLHDTNISSPSLGTPVYSYGKTTHASSGYIRSGVVISTSSIVTGSVSTYDLIQTNSIGLSGDSGGPLFLQASYSGAHSVCGIYTASNKTTEARFSKALNIVNQLNIWVY